MNNVFITTVIGTFSTCMYAALLSHLSTVLCRQGVKEDNVRYRFFEKWISFAYSPKSGQKT